MKNIFELANDAPKLSLHDLDVISRSHDQKKDRCILKKEGLQGMEKMENWGIP
jgi:hypothetical protein